MNISSRKIDFQDVEGLKQLLRRQVITPQRFSLDLPERDLCNGIYAAMCIETELRGKELILDEATKEHIEKASKWLVDKKGKPGLIFLGLYGNGKTTLMKAISRFISFISEALGGYQARRTVKSMTAQQIAFLCADEATRKDFRKLFEEPILSIDDLGEEPGEVISYGMSYAPLVELLTVRYERQLMTLVTTNLKNEEISAKYGKRVADRFNEMMEVVIFENPSYRKQSNSYNLKSI